MTTMEVVMAKDASEVEDNRGDSGDDDYGDNEWCCR